MLSREQQQLVIDNIPLVYSIAKKLKQLGHEDVVQDGFYNLCLAAENYNDKLSGFSTYAYTRIYYGMIDSIKKEIKDRTNTENDLSAIDNLEDMSFKIFEYNMDTKLYFKHLMETINDMNKIIVYMYYCGFTQDEIARKLQRNRTSIARRLKIIKEGEKKNYERKTK